MECCGSPKNTLFIFWIINFGGEFFSYCNSDQPIKKLKSHKRLNFIVPESYKMTAYDASLIQNGWLYFFVEL